MRAALAIIAAVLLIATTAHAGLLDPIYCRLWPSSQGCWLKPAPIPPVKPPVPAPKATAPAPKIDAGRPMPKGPVAAKPQAKPKAAVRAKAKAKPKAAKRKRVIKPKAVAPRRVADRDLTTGECLKLRAANFAGYGIDDVKAAARSRGYTMSFKQIEQAKDCLAGRR